MDWLEKQIALPSLSTSNYNLVHQSLYCEVTFSCVIDTITGSECLASFLDKTICTEGFFSYWVGESVYFGPARNLGILNFETTTKDGSTLQTVLAGTCRSDDKK
jgi:hypothetical protein